MVKYSAAFEHIKKRLYNAKTFVEAVDEFSAYLDTPDKEADDALQSESRRFAGITTAMNSRFGANGYPGFSIAAGKKLIQILRDKVFRYNHFSLTNMERKVLALEAEGKEYTMNWNPNSTEARPFRSVNNYRPRSYNSLGEIFSGLLSGGGSGLLGPGAFPYMGSNTSTSNSNNCISVGTLLSPIAKHNELSITRTFELSETMVKCLNSDELVYHKINRSLVVHENCKVIGSSSTSTSTPLTTQTYDIHIAGTKAYACKVPPTKEPEKKYDIPMRLVLGLDFKGRDDGTKVMINGHNDPFIDLGPAKVKVVDPNRLVAGNNTIRIFGEQCFCSSQRELAFFQVRTYGSVKQKIMDINMNEGMTRDASRRRFQTRQTESQGYDSDVEVSKGMTMNLACPISLKRLKCPVVGNLCSHIQCADLDILIRSCIKEGESWKCPICSKQYQKLSSIRVDPYVCEILWYTMRGQSQGGNDVPPDLPKLDILLKDIANDDGSSPTDITIELDGSWKVAEKEPVELERSNAEISLQKRPRSSIGVKERKRRKAEGNSSNMPIQREISTNSNLIDLTLSDDDGNEEDLRRFNYDDDRNVSNNAIQTAIVGNIMRAFMQVSDDEGGVYSDESEDYW